MSPRYHRKNRLILISSYITSYLIISHHISSYHIISHHISSYHIISSYLPEVWLRDRSSKGCLPTQYNHINHKIIHSHPPLSTLAYPPLIIHPRLSTPSNPPLFLHSNATPLSTFPSTNTALVIFPSNYIISIPPSPQAMLEVQTLNNENAVRK